MALEEVHLVPLFEDTNLAAIHAKRDARVVPPPKSMCLQCCLAPSLDLSSCPGSTGKPLLPYRLIIVVCNSMYTATTHWMLHHTYPL
ncbi:hypothetical protein FRC06_004145 [Ceratobasidium sp. 370]|nr:hypothetical protein FRC06_004145 [Ceratobasidium sp. 370]